MTSTAHALPRPSSVAAAHLVLVRPMKNLVALFALVACLAGHAFTASERDIDREYAAECVRNALGRAESPIQGASGRLVVASATVAIQIHVAVATAAFGHEPLGQKPFHATRSGDYWVVWGSLPSGAVGGTATTVIRARDGAVLHVFVGA
jgi:NTF2 fold immunity protein